MLIDLPVLSSNHQHQVAAMHSNQVSKDVGGGEEHLDDDDDDDDDGGGDDDGDDDYDNDVNGDYFDDELESEFLDYFRNVQTKWNSNQSVDISTGNINV